MRKEFMDCAFDEAMKAFQNDEVPIGAVIVKNNEIIAKSHNSKEVNNCVLNHAELDVIEIASKKLNNWRLDGCDIYITLEPCPMCASAIKQARINNVYCALSNSDRKNGEIINLIFNQSDSLNKIVNFCNDLDPLKSKELLKKFFENKRNK